MNFTKEAQDLSIHILRMNAMPKWDREVVVDIERTLKYVWNEALETATKVEFMTRPCANKIRKLKEKI